MLNGMRYIPPKPGFTALLATPDRARLIYSRDDITGSGITITYTLTFPSEPTTEEVMRIAERLDRVHEFHTGLAMGFMLQVSNILKENKGDEFNPGRAIRQITAAREEVIDNLKRYCEIQRLGKQQLEINDELIYQAEVDRGSKEIATRTPEPTGAPARQQPAAIPSV
jgi:hypothetical protein